MFGHQHPAEFLEVAAAAGQMALVPIRNDRARVVEEVEGRYLVLEIDLNYHGQAKGLSRVFKASRVRRIQLDGLSLELYRMIEPELTVEGLVDTLAERHQLSFFESRGLVFWYLQLLTERGVIAIGLPAADANPDAKGP
jgi:hypothetical protein